MRTEPYKAILAAGGVLSASVTFFISAWKPSSPVDSTFSFSSLAFLAVVGLSAIVASMSIFLTRKIGRQREQRKRVFFIYSRKDAGAVKELAKQLRDRGFNPWLETEEILPGQDWNRAVMNALEESAVALFVASKNTESEDGYYVKEIKAALNVLKSRSEGDSAIIPIRLEEATLPHELTGIQWVDLFSEQGFQQLSRGLERVLKGP